MNKKRFGLLLIWICAFFMSTFLTLVIISFHSTLLINKILRIILLSLLVMILIVLIYGIYIVIHNKSYLLFKKWITIVVSVIVSLYIVGCSSFVFLLYGPYKSFRTWLITTAMNTMNHQYYCKWFYSDKEINKVMKSNYIKEFDEDTDDELVKFEEEKYENEYEKEILEHKKNALYKIIKFKVNGQQAYLAAVYDASKISVGLTKYLEVGGQYVTTIAKNNNAVLAINGGGFMDINHNSTGGSPIGVTISHGKIITDHYVGGYQVIGFNKNNVLVIKRNITATQAINEGIRDAVTMMPSLIVNGKPAFTKGNGGWGYAARTAIGQRKDGIVLFLVVDSNSTRTKGASMVDLTNIMLRYGAINAANLDGGTSSVMAVNGEMINDPIDSTGAHKTRGIPTIFMVKE